MKSRKKNADSPTPANGPSFEQAIQRLEQIVADMEGAELPLEDVLKKYEEGTHLVRFCSQKLNEAEKKIELLSKKADGSVELKRFEAAESETTNDDKDEKEAKLFALACSQPPAGRARWTLRLLEEKVVELDIVERASDNTIGRTLKKTLSNRICASNG